MSIRYSIESERLINCGMLVRQENQQEIMGHLSNLESAILTLRRARFGSSPRQVSESIFYINYK